MLRPALLALSLAVAPFAAVAQTCGSDSYIDDLSPEDRARLDALVAPHPFPEGNFWRAEKDGSTVIVAGTIHVPDPRLTPLVDRIAGYLGDVDVLILEATSEDEAGIQTLAATNPEMFFLTSGPSLIDLLGPEDWALTKEKFEAIGIPGILGAKFKPWYASISLAIAPCAMAAIQSGQKGFDRQLESRAIEAGVPLATLDNTEDVLRIFADEPLEKQIDGLRLTLETNLDGARATATLLEAYFDEKVREGWEFSRIQIEQAGIEDGVEMFEEVNREVLVARNEAWEPKIVALTEGKDAILAVGAAHLSGETGVLRALERAGYEVSPL